MNIERSLDIQVLDSPHFLNLDILCRACMKFKHLLLSIMGSNESKLDPKTNTDKMMLTPFLFCTISSVCIDVFRTLHLQETLEENLKGETRVREAKDKIRINKESDV